MKKRDFIPKETDPVIFIRGKSFRMTINARYLSSLTDRQRKHFWKTVNK
jgi:hypothetical protein